MEAQGRETLLVVGEGGHVALVGVVVIGLLLAHTGLAVVAVLGGGAGGVLLLLGTHAVIVEPVDHCLHTHTQSIGQTLNGALVRVWVAVVSLTKPFFLLLGEENSRPLGQGHGGIIALLDAVPPSAVS